MCPVHALNVPSLLWLPPQQLEDECAAHIVPVIKHAVEDRSWRVRCAMARGFAKAAHAVGPKLTTVELLPCLTRYVFSGAYNTPLEEGVRVRM